jgi:hypothetical protein
LSWAEEERYEERTMVERVNARLKDEFGRRTVRVRGAMIFNPKSTLNNSEGACF